MLAAALLGPLAAVSEAATLPYALAASDFGAPSSFGFTFSAPYADGPFDSAAASVGGTLTDRAGDGATLSGTVANKVNGSTVISSPLSCSIGAGTAGTVSSCPGGAGSGSTASATSRGTTCAATNPQHGGQLLDEYAER